MKIRTASLFLLVLYILSTDAFAQSGGFQDPLLERMVGTWVMTGTIAGQQITHDLDIEWILAHQYLRIYEISRELDSTGNPQYEAYVHIGWDPERKQYACLWLDITGGNGLIGRSIGHATREGNSLPFVFNAGDGRTWHTTFTYEEAPDEWQWTMEAKRGEEVAPFASVRLRHSK